MSTMHRHLMVSMIVLQTAFAASCLPAISAGNSQKQNLHRADFRIEGASCVVCLRRIGKTIREDKGVLKADVSVFKPYWAIVIYDANQTNFQNLTDSIKNEKVKLQQLEDKPIAAMPSIIIPKGLSLDPATTTSGKSTNESVAKPKDTGVH